MLPERQDIGAGMILDKRAKSSRMPMARKGLPVGRSGAIGRSGVKP